MAMASRFLGVGARATGLAVVATGTAVGRFIASILFGGLWSAFGPDTAITAFLLALPAVAVVSWIVTTKGGPTDRLDVADTGTTGAATGPPA